MGLIPDMPRSAKIQLNRQEFVVSKLIEGVPDEVRRAAPLHRPVAAQSLRPLPVSGRRRRTSRGSGKCRIWQPQLVQDRRGVGVARRPMRLLPASSLSRFADARAPHSPQGLRPLAGLTARDASFQQIPTTLPVSYPRTQGRAHIFPVPYRSRAVQARR